MHHLPEGNFFFIFGRALHRAWHQLQDNWVGMVLVALIIVVMYLICYGIVERIERKTKMYKL